MPRPKYQIQPTDIPHALAYLHNALEDPNYPVKAPGRKDFVRYLEQLAKSMDDDPEADARIFNTWCETCLNSDQWRRLKTSIRKRRYQAINGEEVQATLSKEAHDALLALKSLSQTNSLSAALIWAYQQLK
mgnify:FL=1